VEAGAKTVGKKVTISFYSIQEGGPIKLIFFVLVIVVIVSDGRVKCNAKTLNVLSVMGCYMDGLAKASVNGKNVTGHVFEYTNQVNRLQLLSFFKIFN
jgi:hypothetical protein